MATLKYDVTDTEEFVPYAGPTPPRGIYAAVVRSAEFKTSANGNPMFEIMVVLEGKSKEQAKFKGCPIFQVSTIGDLSEDWMKRNLKNLVKAFNKGEKGSLNPEAFAKAMVNKKIRVIVQNEKFNDDIRAKGNGLLPYKAGDDEEVAGVSDEEEPEDAEEPEEADGEEPEADEPEEDDLADLNRAQLKAIIKSEGHEIKVTRGMSDDSIREAITEARGGSEDSDEEEPDEEEPDTEEVSVEDEIAELDRAALKKYIKENSLEVKVTTKMSDDDIREAILQAWPEDEGEGDESEPPF